MNKNHLKIFSYKPILSLLAISTILLLSSCQGEKSETPGQPAASSAAAGLRGGEDRPTLSPSAFTGEVARAYRIAQEIPEVLDSLYCYCDCKLHFDHKSLLTCYVDEHAKNCDICMDEAFMAYELHSKGMGIEDIRKAVDERFARTHH